MYVSNTAHDQAWQHELDSITSAPVQADEGKHLSDGLSGLGEDIAMGVPGPTGAPPSATIALRDADVQTGKGVAGWVLRIDGRLLDVSDQRWSWYYDVSGLIAAQSGNARLDKTKRKFTSFLRSAVVEFDNRQAPTYPEGNIVEVCSEGRFSVLAQMSQWQPQNLQAPLDGFEILRRGDVNVDCRIVLHVAHYPERFRVLAPLDGLIFMKEGTRSDVMSAVWKLVKVVGGQDKEDGTMIRPVGGLEKVRSSVPRFWLVYSVCRSCHLVKKVFPSISCQN